MKSLPKRQQSPNGTGAFGCHLPQQKLCQTQSFSDLTAYEVAAAGACGPLVCLKSLAFASE